MIVSGQKVIFIVCFAIFGAILLMPEKSELMGRVIEDGDLDRALELIGEKPTTESIDDLVTKFSNTTDPAIFTEITVLLTLVRDPKEALDCIVPKSSSFSRKQKRRVCELVAKRGLELNDLDTCLRGYQWLAQSVPLDENELSRAITISRYAGLPQIAIAFIKQNLRQKGLDYEDLPESQRNLLVALNREVNRGSEALEFLKKELMLTGQDDWSRWEVLELLTTVAIQSNKVKDALPVLEKYVVTTDAGKSTWKQFLARKEPHPTDEKFLQFGKPLAQNYEWTSNVAKAFPYYIKLAYLGDEYSMKRCFALYDWAQKWEQMLDLLHNIPMEQLTYEQLATYVKLEGSVTNYSKAIELCSVAFAHPEADMADLHKQRGLFLAQLGRYEDAVTDLKKSIELDPENASLLERIASIEATRGNYEEAMLTYRQIPFEDQTEQGFDHYAYLAESLQSQFDQLRIAGYAIDDKSRASSEAYLDLYSIFIEHGKEKEAYETLDFGIEQFPDSKKLKLAKIDYYMERKQFKSAFTEIKKSYDKTDPRYLQRMIAIGEVADNPWPMVRLLPLKDPYAEDWSEGLRIELALLYERLEYIQRAIKIWRSFDEQAIHLKQLNAKLSMYRKRHRDALAFQETYVAANPNADSDAWKFLGDIYKKMNRTSDSKKAYTVAARKKKAEQLQL